MQPPEFENIFFYFQFVQESMSCANQSHRYERWTAKFSREGDQKGLNRLWLVCQPSGNVSPSQWHSARKILSKKTKVRKNIWSAVNLELNIIWFILYVKVKVICLYSAVSSLRLTNAVYALLVDLFNRTPFYIIHKIQPVTRHVHAMLLTWCFSHPQLAGGEQGRHRPDWHFDWEGWCWSPSRASSS